MSANSWSELLRAKASIYALNEITKQWSDRGTSGQLILYQNSQSRQEVHIKWSKNKKEVWWQLINASLKPKGERAWVLKAWDAINHKQEILAVRFSDLQSSTAFAAQYNRLFPPQFQQPVFQPMPMNMQQMQAMQPNMNANGWECAVCTYGNDRSKNACNMCGLSAEASAKARMKSNNVNNPLNMVQAMGSQKLIHSGNNIKNISQNEDGPWTCTSCTFVNKAQTLACGVCGTHKPLNTAEPIIKLNSQKPLNTGARQPPPTRPLPGKTWICPLCTLQNDNNASRCEACHTLKSPAMDGQRQTGMPNAMGSMPMTNMAMPMQMPAMAMNPMNAMMVNPLMSQIMMSPDNINKLMHSGMMTVNNNNSQKGASVQQFQRAASDIACYNDAPKPIFLTLKSVTKKLLKNDIRYRTLDTTNPKVIERLVGFEGVLDFLMLLGFESDEMGMKLVCEQKPTQQMVNHAVSVLNSYETRLGLGAPPMQNQQMPMQSRPSPGNVEQKQDNNSEEDTLTLEQIILWSTHESMRDTETMQTLVITHKTITDSVTLLKQLRRRFFVPIPRELIMSGDDSAITHFKLNVQKSIQLKVIKALRDWMKLYWDEDFSIKHSENGQEMQTELQLWIDELDKVASNDPQIKAIRELIVVEFERKKNNVEVYDYQKSQNLKKRIHLEFDEKSAFGLLRAILPAFKQGKHQSSEYLEFNQRTCVDYADQITLMDYEIFSAIEARECIGQSWKKKNNKKSAPHILGLIQQFNNLTLLVQIYILRERTLKDRSKTLKNVIAMGQRFRELRNYNSLCAIYSALNSAPVHRLKVCWTRIPQKYVEMFENFKTIFSRDFNHRNLRQLFRNAPTPSIPHIGLFLQDLVFIDDGNSTKIEIDNFKQHGSMVNFSKCVRITDRVKGIKLYQSHPYIQNDTKAHNLQNKPNIQKLLLSEFQKLSNVTEDQIWDMSSEIKKQDEKDAKKNMF